MKTIKSNLLLIVLLFITISTSLIFYKAYTKSKLDITRLENNLYVKDSKISTLTLTTKELKGYLGNLDTKYKQEMDSILKNRKINIKYLKSYERIYINNIDTDTIKSVIVETKLKSDSLYQINFSNAKKCLKIYGYVESLDSASNIFITKIEGVNNIYITESYKKSFWDYILFRKGKLIRNTTSDCGEILDNVIDIK